MLTHQYKYFFKRKIILLIQNNNIKIQISNILIKTHKKKNSIHNQRASRDDRFIILKKNVCERKKGFQKFVASTTLKSFTTFFIFWREKASTQEKIKMIASCNDKDMHLNNSIRSAMY